MDPKTPADRALLAPGAATVSAYRFRNQLTTGFGNYTEERRELFRDLTLDDVIAEIEKEQGEVLRSPSAGAPE